MLRVIDLVYHHHAEYDRPEQVRKKHAPSLGFAAHTAGRLQLLFVKHLNYQGEERVNGVGYAYFRGKNRWWHLFLKTHLYIRRQRPDVVIVEGLVFPLQLLTLRLLLRRSCRIVAQHHGERPSTGVKGWLQKIACRHTDLFLFTSLANAGDWITRKIITHPAQCRALLEASTGFRRMDEGESRRRTGITGTQNFLWVGRLDDNKDPFTVLAAFEAILPAQPDARLYLIYPDAGPLLPLIAQYLQARPLLRRAVQLVGRVRHEDMPCWYTAASFYVSASHREGSGYALLEALACGCIPIVTAIPSFIRITSNGAFGFLYPPGQAAALEQLFARSRQWNIGILRKNIEQYFQEHLHYRNIADDCCRLLYELARRQEPGAPTFDGAGGQGMIGKKDSFGEQ